VLPRENPHPLACTAHKPPYRSSATRSIPASPPQAARPILPRPHPAHLGPVAGVVGQVPAAHLLPLAAPDPLIRIPAAEQSGEGGHKGRLSDRRHTRRGRGALCPGLVVYRGRCPIGAGGAFDRLWGESGRAGATGPHSGWALQVPLQTPAPPGFHSHVPDASLDEVKAPVKDSEYKSPVVWESCVLTSNNP